MRMLPPLADAIAAAPAGLRAGFGGIAAHVRARWKEFGALCYPTLAKVLDMAEVQCRGKENTLRPDAKGADSSLPLALA